MWSGDGRVDLLRLRSQRRGEHLGDCRRRPAAAPRQVTRFTDGRLLWPSITARRHVDRLRAQLRDLEAGRRLLARRAEVPITRTGAPAGQATEHLRLTSQFQELALSPDGKKVAFVARGEIFAASAKDGGDAVRVTTTPAAEVADRLVARQPRGLRMRRSATEPRACSPTTSSRIAKTPVTSGDALEGDYAPRFSPDGTDDRLRQGGRGAPGHRSGVEAASARWRKG